MSNLTEQKPAADAIPSEALDRILVAVDHAVEQARRSAVVTSPLERRMLQLRRERQARFDVAWGLR